LDAWERHENAWRTSSRPSSPGPASGSGLLRSPTAAPSSGQPLDGQADDAQELFLRTVSCAGHASSPLRIHACAGLSAQLRPHSQPPARTRPERMPPQPRRQHQQTTTQPPPATHRAGTTQTHCTAGKGLRNDLRSTVSGPVHSTTSPAHRREQLPHTDAPPTAHQRVRDQLAPVCRQWHQIRRSQDARTPSQVVVSSVVRRRCDRPAMGSTTKPHQIHQFPAPPTTGSHPGHNLHHSRAAGVLGIESGRPWSLW
jgi:hypothetical protein